MPLYVRNQDASEEIKSTNWGNEVCTLSFSFKHTHNFCLLNGSSEGCGRGLEREGWKERRPMAGSSLGARAHSPSWHRGWQQLQGAVGREDKYTPPHTYG